MKGTKIAYWIVTGLFCAMMLMDGISGIMQVEGGKAPLLELGYPFYLMVITGIFKSIGSLAIIQTKFRILKEWAYAGFTINFLGAAMSWIAVEKPVNALFPVIGLAIMFTSYSLWKKAYPAG